MLAWHCKITDVQSYEIDLVKDFRLQQKASFWLMSTHVKGQANLKYTQLDGKNYLKVRRQRSIGYREISFLMQYFHHQLLENLYFFHAY